MTRPVSPAPGSPGPGRGRGYAQFPGGKAATDGIVILHSAFGTTGTAAAPFHLGRTATHEIGHWLNLFHIWGDDGTGCSGTDFVADTPNQGGHNTGAPVFPHVSCSNGPNGDMFMNYMDYTDDAAMFMFTEGQAARMDATLDGARSSFTRKLFRPVYAQGNPGKGIGRLRSALIRGPCLRVRLREFGQAGSPGAVPAQCWHDLDPAASVIHDP
jgi:hypothetical protein